MLDFSKIEAGKLSIEPTSVALRPLLEDVVMSLAPVAREKSVEVVAFVEAPVPDHVMVAALLTFGNDLCATAGSGFTTAALACTVDFVVVFSATGSPAASARKGCGTIS